MEEIQFELVNPIDPFCPNCDLYVKPSEPDCPRCNGRDWTKGEILMRVRRDQKEE